MVLGFFIGYLKSPREGSFRGGALGGYVERSTLNFLPRIIVREDCDLRGARGAGRSRVRIRVKRKRREGEMKRNREGVVRFPSDSGKGR